MALIPKRTRVLKYLIPILLVLVLFSLSSTHPRRAHWYENLLWWFLDPPQRVVNFISNGVTETWSHYFMLVGVKVENEQLQRKLAELEGVAIRTDETSKENERLRSLLNYKNQLSKDAVVARVIDNDPRAEFKSIRIDKGTEDGILPNMPVIGAKGLVGRIGRAGSHDSRVLLLNDPNSAIDAMIERSRRRGLAVGMIDETEFAAGSYLTRVEYLERTTDVVEGDPVVTSGLDSIFPAGLPIGSVKEVQTSRYGVFKEATIVPYENLAELQEVLVVLWIFEQPQQPAKDKVKEKAKGK